MENHDGTDYDYAKKKATEPVKNENDPKWKVIKKLCPVNNKNETDEPKQLTLFYEQMQIHVQLIQQWKHNTRTPWNTPHFCKHFEWKYIHVFTEMVQQIRFPKNE